LTKRDVKNVPTVIGYFLFPFFLSFFFFLQNGFDIEAGKQHFGGYKIRPNSTFVQRSVLRDIARRKGRTVVEKRVVEENDIFAGVHVLYSSI
jgi:hypothetical protein